MVREDDSSFLKFSRLRLYRCNGTTARRLVPFLETNICIALMFTLCMVMLGEAADTPLLSPRGAVASNEQSLLCQKIWPTTFYTSDVEFPVP